MSAKYVALIAARSKNGVIGTNGEIPWKIKNSSEFFIKNYGIILLIKGEQSQFKELTTGNTVILGRKSYEEIGHPLPNRETIVVSRQYMYKGEHLNTAWSLEEALAMVPDGQIAYIAGGYGLFKEALEKDLVDRMYLTEIDVTIKGCKGAEVTYFPEFDESLFDKTTGNEISAYDSKFEEDITYHRDSYLRERILEQER